MHLQQDIHSIADCNEPDMSHQPTEVDRKQPVAFLELSAELRNEVYHYALTAELPVLVRYQDCVKAPSSKLRKWGHHFSSPSTALLRTCRTIRNEATPIFLGNNTLSLPFLATRLNAFTNHVSVYIKHIRGIRLRLRDMDSRIVAALTALKQFPSLGSLEIVKGPIHRFPGPMAHLFLPLVKSLAATRSEIPIPEGKVLETIGLDVMFLARDSLGGSPRTVPQIYGVCAEEHRDALCRQGDSDIGLFWLIV